MKPMIAAFLLCLTTALPSFATENRDPDSPEEIQERAAEFMKAKIEQAEYFSSFEQNMQFFDLTGTCKYISGISRPAIEKTVTLTFDDGPSAALTPKALDILKKYGIKATFFILGKNVESSRAIIERARMEGHLIASHSWSHPNFHTISIDQQRKQISQTDELIHEYATPLKLFRYPYGSSTCPSKDYIKSLGYSGIVGWHIDTCDWAFAGKGYVTDQEAKICGVASANKNNYVHHVLANVRQRHGGIVLMHDVHAQTVNNLEAIIVGLLAEDFQFVNLDDGQMTQFFVN